MHAWMLNAQQGIKLSIHEVNMKSYIHEASMGTTSENCIVSVLHEQRWHHWSGSTIKRDSGCSHPHKAKTWMGSHRIFPALGSLVCVLTPWQTSWCRRTRPSCNTFCNHSTEARTNGVNDIKLVEGLGWWKLLP